MTRALKKAFAAASQLPDREQDELAAAILQELAADQRWEAGRFASGRLDAPVAVRVQEGREFF
jgi:hypothetical protein